MSYPVRRQVLSYFSVKIYVVTTQWNHLEATVLMRVQLGIYFRNIDNYLKIIPVSPSYLEH